MRTFEHPNTGHGWQCPICHTKDDKEVVLVGITRTEDGGNIEAEQIHLDCIDLMYDKDCNILYQKLKQNV